MSANAFNLARRLSVRNEADLVQEDMAYDSHVTPPNSPYTYRSCFEMIDKVSPDFPLPKDCERYADIKNELKRRNSDRRNHNIAFEGMSPGEACMAKAARERGQLNHAQIQRRMTSERKKTIW